MAKIQTNDSASAVVEGEEIVLAEDAERCHALRQELIVLKESATEHFFRMGEIMKDIKENELWRAGGYESFPAFCADPEVDLPKSSVNHAINMVKMFPEWQKFTDIAERRLIAISPYLTNENRNELVNQARSLSAGDLAHQLMLMRIATKRPEIKTFPKIYPCNTCGKVKGVTWRELCHCGWTPKQTKYVGALIDHINVGGKIRDNN